MAEPYLTDLRELARKWVDADAGVGVLDCRHFFAGAAVYRDGAIVASLTPVGLAFKVSSKVHDEVMSRGVAVPLRYFPKGPIKQNYVLFPTVAGIHARDAASLLLGESMEPT